MSTGRWRLWIVVACALLLCACAPSEPADALDHVARLSGGGELSCAHRDDGSTWCWGDGSLSKDADSKFAHPIAIEHVLGTTRSAFRQTCILRGDRTVACSDGGLFAPYWPTSPSLVIAPATSYSKARQLRGRERIRKLVSLRTAEDG